MKIKEYIYLMKYFYSTYLFLLSCSLFAQTVGINSTGAVPATSAMLDVFAVDKGLLIPRVDIIDLNTAVPVSSPTTSLLVYNTNATSGVGYYFWGGSKWINLKDSGSNADEDWYKVGTVSSPDDITNKIFTMGKVGIGINNPVSLLELRNSSNTIYNLSIHNGGGNALGILVSGGNSGSTSSLLKVMDNAEVNTFFEVRDGNSYFDNGNVGIGTPTPTAKLDVLGVYDDIGVKITKVTGNLGRAQLYLDENRNASGGAHAKHIQFANGATPLVELGVINDASGLKYFYIDADQTDIGNTAYASADFVIKENGNVGIGAVSPNAPLEVSPVNISAIQEGIRLIDEGSGSSEGLWLQFGQLAINDYARVGGRSYNNTSGGLYFSTKSNSDATPIERLRVDVDGNVGIGLTVPNYLLHLKSTSTTQLMIEGDQQGFVNAALVLKSNEGVNARGTGIFMFDRGGQNEWFIGRPYYGGGLDSDSFVIQRQSSLADHSTSSGAIEDGTGNATGTERFLVVDKLGNVGIGTSSPGSRLHLLTPAQFGSVNVRFVSGNSNADNVDVTGNSTDVYLDHIVGATFNATVATVLNRTATFKIDDAPVIGANLTVTDNMALWVESGNSSFGGNVSIGTTTPTSKLQVVGLLEYADNAAAVAGGLTIGAFYRTGDLLKVVH